MSKTADALADFVSTLNIYAEITSRLIDVEASDQEKITQLTQQRDQLTTQLDSQTSQLASSVDDASAASSITSAAQILKDNLKKVSDKAAAATPGTPSSEQTPVTTPSQLPPTGQLPPAGQATTPLASV